MLQLGHLKIVVDAWLWRHSFLIEKNLQLNLWSLTTHSWSSVSNFSIISIWSAEISSILVVKRSSIFRVIYHANILNSSKVSNEVPGSFGIFHNLVMELEICNLFKLQFWINDLQRFSSEAWLFLTFVSKKGFALNN